MISYLAWMIGAGTPLLPAPSRAVHLFHGHPPTTPFYLEGSAEPYKEATEDRAVFLKLGFILEAQRAVASLESVSPMGILLLK